MRLCSVKAARVGMILGKSIYLSNRRLLLGAGFRITSEIKDKLIERGYSHIYIMEPGTENIIPEDIISDEIRLQAQAKLSDKVKKIEESMQFTDMSRAKSLELIESGYLKDIYITFDIRKVVEQILQEISDLGSTFLNTIMIKSNDSYFLDHAINTTVLAILIGNKYRFSKSELTSLALGTFLHDIGKIVIEQLKNSQERDRWVHLYKEHPTFGYLMLTNDSHISAIESQIVNQHHENQDGNGFPIGLKGQNLPPVKSDTRETKGCIFRLAEICSVVDAYDNLVLNPMEDEKLTPQEVIKKLLLDSGTIYNKDIVQTLSQVVAIFPVGAWVRITNANDPHLVGSYGVVAKVEENNLTRPVIIITKNKYHSKIKPVMIDTSKLIFVELKLIL